MLTITISLLLLTLTSCMPSPVSIADSNGQSSEQYGDLYLSISGLKSLYKGDSQRIGEAAYIVATVTANNTYGEFSDRLVVEDESGGIEIAVDIDDYLYLYGIGTQITLNCTDLWIGGYDGTLVLGSELTASSDDVVEVLEYEAFEERILNTNADNEPPTPEPLTIPELSTRYISCYVSLSDLSFSDNSGGVDTSFCQYDEELDCRLTTTHTMYDQSGNQITLFVSSTVSYANEPLPNSSSLLICAILSSYGGNYSATLVERRIYEM